MTNFNNLKFHYLDLKVLVVAETPIRHFCDIIHLSECLLILYSLFHSAWPGSVSVFLYLFCAPPIERLGPSNCLEEFCSRTISASSLRDRAAWSVRPLRHQINLHIRGSLLEQIDVFGCPTSGMHLEKQVCMQLYSCVACCDPPVKQASVTLCDCPVWWNVRRWDAPVTERFHCIGEMFPFVFCSRFNKPRTTHFILVSI